MASKNKKAEPKDTGYQQLKADLKAGEPARLYFFFGEETYLRDTYLEQLKKLILPEGMEDFNLHTLHGSDCTPEALEDIVDQMPMMSERSLALVWDYDVFTDTEERQEAFAGILQDLPDYLCLVFLYDSIKLDQRRFKGNLGKLVKGKPCLVEFKRQSETDLVPWIERHMKEAGKTIKPAEARYLIEVTGGMMQNMLREIEKVAAYAKGDTITQADIDAVVDPVLDVVAFHMTDAIIRGDYDRAAAILADLFTAKQDTLMILGAISKQMRQLYVARLAIEQGKSENWLVDACGMNPKAMRAIMSNARRFSGQWYRKAIQLTEQTDIRMKRSFNEGEAMLTELLVRFAEVSKVC